MTELEEDIFTAPPALAETPPELVVYDFTVDIADPYRLQANTPSLNWKKIGWIAGGVVGVVGLTLLVIALFFPKLLQPAPIRVSMTYFELLNAQKYESAFDLMEPGTVDLRQFQKGIETIIQSFFPGGLPYEWEFVNMEFSDQEIQPGQFHVQTNGYLRIIDKQTGRYLDLPYSQTLQLVKLNGHWYIRP